MAFSTAQKLMQLDVPTPLARELGSQLDSGTYSIPRLIEMGMDSGLAQIVAAPAQFDPNKATQLGMVPAVAAFVKKATPTGIVFNSTAARNRISALRTSVIKNTARVRVFAGHDSTMYGQGTGTGANLSDGSFDQSILAKAAAILRGMGIQALSEGQIGDGGRYSTMALYNPRWTTLGAGWSGGADLSLGGYAFRNSTDSTSLAYSPLVDVDSFDVIYGQASSQANFDLAIDGGSATTVNPAGTAACMVATKTAAKGDHTLTITRTGASGFTRITGVIPYDSTTAAFDLVMASIPGSTSSRVNGATVASVSPLPMLQQLKPKIWLSLVGINDMRTPITAAVSRANMQTTFDAISADTDFICIAPNRFLDGAVPESTQDAWRDMLYSFCSDNGITLIDPTIEYPTYDAMLAAGFMADALHPNALWTARLGRMLANVIRVA